MATFDQATAAAAKVRTFLAGRSGLVGVGVGEKPNGYVVKVYGTNDLHTDDLPAGVDRVPVLVFRTDPPVAYGAQGGGLDGVALVLGGVALLAGATALRARGSRSGRYADEGWRDVPPSFWSKETREWNDWKAKKVGGTPTASAGLFDTPSGLVAVPLPAAVMHDLRRSAQRLVPRDEDGGWRWVRQAKRANELAELAEMDREEIEDQLDRASENMLRCGSRDSWGRTLGSGSFRFRRT